MRADGSNAYGQNEDPATISTDENAPAMPDPTLTPLFEKGDTVRATFAGTKKA